MDEDDQKTLPKILLGPAGTAISHLIGSVTDIPAAWLEQQAQGIKDATAARSHVTQALGTQTAKTAVTDPEIMERAGINMVATAYRRQKNKEGVALKTIKTCRQIFHPNRVTGRQRIGWHSSNAMPKMPQATSCRHCLRSY